MWREWGSGVCGESEECGESGVCGVSAANNLAPDNNNKRDEIMRILFLLYFICVITSKVIKHGSF